MEMKKAFVYLILLLLFFTVVPAAAQEDHETMAKKLANPLAALISVPLEYDTYTDIGPEDNGERWAITAKPVVPVSLNRQWNLISRTIISYTDQEDIAPGAGSQSGLSDLSQSLFFSPARPSSNGLIWGIGPVFLFPTATDDLLGAEKWGAGPTGVVLKQSGPWTYGLLANHVWSFAGDDDRSDISTTFLQPFLAYTLKTATTFSLNTESTYDWNNENWTVPLNASVSQVLKLGKQLFQLKAGLRYYAESAPSAPEGWGIKLGVIFMFPR